MSENICEYIVNKLAEENLTISFAESCTGGMLAANLTEIPGASKVLHSSYVTYNNEAKVNELGVVPYDIESCTEVSQVVASEMTEGLRSKTGADICVAVTGYAGPEGGTEENPVGTVYIGFLADYMGLSQKFYYPYMSRKEVRESVCGDVFELIWKYLELYY